MKGGRMKRFGSPVSSHQQWNSSFWLGRWARNASPLCSTDTGWLGVDISTLPGITRSVLTAWVPAWVQRWPVLEGVATVAATPNCGCLRPGEGDSAVC